MKIQKNTVLTAIEAIIIAVLTFVVCLSDAFSAFETLMSDKAYQSPRAINNKIKIIAIDDRTLREVGPMNTWSRQVYADVINYLGDTPDVIVLDLMITGNMDESGDKALYDACEKSGRVVAGSYINFNSVYRYTADGAAYIDNTNIETVDLPIMADVCLTGFVNALPDEDGVMRSTPIMANYNGEILESLSYRAYKFYCQKNGIPQNTPKLDAGRMQLNYAGRPGDYEIIPLCSILDGTVDPRIFTGCVVFVGAYAKGLYDQYAVPNSADLMFGAEIHANIFQSLIDGKYPVKADRTAASLVFAFTAALVYILLRHLKLKFSVPLAIFISAGYVAAAMLINNGGLTLPLIYLPVFTAAGCILGIVHHYITANAEKRSITEAFRKYVAPQIVDDIAKTGSYSIKLGGENRDIAVLFVDIRGFTPMSESLEPEQVVDILNSYLELTTKSIFNNGGTLDKFIGDATMAVFNAPFDLDDHVFRAVKTALDIVAGGNEIESRFMEKYGKTVGFGVGVNCGRAVVGNIGCSFRMDYTAIGDTVNTAARLEANAKKGQVLISEAVYEQVKDRITADPIGEIPLKGKSKGVFVYSVTGLV